MKTIEVPHDLFLSDLYLSDLFLSDLPLSRRFPGSRTPDNPNSHGLGRMVRLTLASCTMVQRKP
jgi:hypothetical protein